MFPILLIIFTNILGAGVIIPVLPLYAEGQFAGTVLQITLLASAFFGAQFIAAPVLGQLSDRYGRRPVLVLSQVGTIASFVLFILAAPIGAWIDSFGLALPLTGGMLMLFVARILDGITGGNITIAQAYVTDVITDEERAQGLGMLQAAFGAGFIFGPALGGVLSGFGPVAPFVGAALITTGTLLLTLFTLEESLPPEERGRSRARPRVLPPLDALRANQALAMLLGIGFTASLAFSALPSTFALYASRELLTDIPDPERTQLYIGLMLTFVGMVQVFTQAFLLRPLVSRLGERRLLVVGEISVAISMAGFAAATGPVFATAAMIPFAFGFGSSEPTSQSMMSRFGQGRERGQYLGYYQSARSLALIVGPIWAGWVFQNVAPSATYWVGAVIASVAAILAVQLLRRPAQERQPAPAASD